MHHRSALIDGLRGYFLVFMTLNHLGFQDGAWIQRFNHARLGFVEDAQGFVFLSGLVVGLAYARTLERQGSRSLWRKAGSRIASLYRMILALLALLVAAAVVLPDSGMFWSDYLGVMLDAPRQHWSIAAALAYQPVFIDTLPQYLLYLLMAPLLVRWIAAGHGPWVLLGSAGLWLATQFNLHLPLVRGIERIAIEVLPPVGIGEIRAYFNPLAWQILFVVGLVLGVELRCRRLDVEQAISPGPGFAVLSAAFVLAFMACKLALDWGLAAGDLRAYLIQLLRRQDLSLIYVANFAATGYLVAWLILHGPQAPSAWARGPARALTALFHLRFLGLLGRHSLEVYAWHVLVAYSLVALNWYYGPFGEGLKTVLALLAIASLALPALLLERRRGAPQTPLVGTAPG